MMLSAFLSRIVRVGELTVITPSGRRQRFGPGGAPAVTVRLHHRALYRKLIMNPDLYLGEAYMDGTLTVEEGSLRDLLELCTANGEALDSHPIQRVRRRLGRPLRYLQQYNPLGRSRANVAHHYDLSAELFDLFLDRDRQYSCAYFPDGNESLEQAQEKKKRHIAAKLLLQPDMRVLDIGSGWGGLALHIAESAGARVKGITLSEEQLKVAQQRAVRSGLAERARFELLDYRAEREVYDRIVSVGMFEHVGVSHYGGFFRTLKGLLKPDGVALIHAIGRMEPPGQTNPWLRKYIFPGGYCPALSEVLAAVEKAGLWVTDIEVLRLDYAETLREWARRFAANREQVRAFYDERFCRMWEFYLNMCEMAFRNGPIMVFQIQLTRQRDAVPSHRNYIADWEHALENDANEVA
ncbi:MULTISPECIES: SAM-dependent methyltransferase [Halomonadaceae]|uniref:Class I SAM-dependent methyltransferase n=2 Tax=Vreelandella TaxID=3137766 RepID=A0A7Z0RZD1_9GAMM|nr:MULTISPECIES: cyclopropane-fatty-acyl-phospholipid synthase family protein [Halomonas]AJY52760.1 Cyclopropane-fatty-acyl-phospholipid synthase [Halomonas sp. KO116]NYS79140.1 class I SAM-dependent methyltransferase [Halomonas glaciei]|tara:strand:+ start:1013 stop:2239 length:1227 start_codon:yes stop_codon:yes gene_type:complete